MSDDNFNSNLPGENLQDNSIKSNIVPIKVNKSLIPDVRFINILNNRILDTVSNLEAILNAYNISVRFNMMKRRREMIIPNKSFFNVYMDFLTQQYIYNLATIHRMPTKNLSDHIDTIAMNNCFHPIVDYIESKPWDNLSRLADFINTLSTPASEFAAKLLTTWMVSAVAALYSKNGFAAHGVLVLQGPQSIGKTRWVKSLAPSEFDAIKEGMILQPTNKDDIITTAQHWIIELGELDGTFRRAHIAKLKSFLTNAVDVVRLPYGKNNLYYTRHNVFVATVNNTNFLVDDTGNRRFWTIPVTAVNNEHQIDMQQVWAEVLVLFKKGGTTYLESNDIAILNQSNEDFEQLDPLEEKLDDYFNWCDDWRKYNTMQASATRVLELMGYNNPTVSQTTRMGDLLRKKTGQKPSRTARERLHTIPNLKPRN